MVLVKLGQGGTVMRGIPTGALTVFHSTISIDLLRS
jgi:hypothetical protein